MGTACILWLMGVSYFRKITGIVIPNILLGNCTNVILDIKRDLIKKYGYYLKQHGIGCGF